MHMDATRTERITVNLTPELIAALDRFAERNRWTRSMAALVLIERGLEDEE
jgi:metal-responsive CopG/Arc/MetJ family transcriptional regulator